MVVVIEETISPFLGRRTWFLEVLVPCPCFRFAFSRFAEADALAHAAGDTTRLWSGSAAFWMGRCTRQRLKSRLTGLSISDPSRSFLLTPKGKR